MKNFKFSQQYTDNERQDIEKILKERKRKIVKQQLIYSLILVAIAAVFAMWLYRKTAYAEFDGYITADVNNHRAPDDIYFIESRFRVGDLVVPGDTMFTYIHANHLNEYDHHPNEPTVIVNNRDYRTSLNLARADLGVLKVRIAELQRQLEVEDHNIRFGLSDNRNKLRTEQQLAEAKEQYEAQRRKIGTYGHALGTTSKNVARISNQGYGSLSPHEIRDPETLRKAGLLRYSIATDSMLVTKKFVSQFSFVLRGETIMTSQSLDLKRNNLAAVAYVMPDEMNDVNHHSRATIHVNDDVSFTANVMMLGARTEDLPGELRSTLSRDHTSVIVVFDIEPGQKIPFWALTDKVPIKVRIPRFQKKKERVDDYLIYDTSTGIDTLTLDYIERHTEADRRGVTLSPDTTVIAEYDEFDRK